MAVAQWVKDLTESIIPNKLAIGMVCKHTDGRTVKIVGGQYWGEHGVSNFWHWRELKENGELGPEERGYGWNLGNV